MLAPEHRLTRRAEFTAVLRGGRRSGRRRVVVHALAGSGTERVGVPAASRLGLVVSTAVGGSVVRHRVARRLRHVAGELLTVVPEHTDLVVRALPASARASSDELRRDLRDGLRALGLLGSSR